MAGLVPAIHVFSSLRLGKDVSAKTRFALFPGHDDQEAPSSLMTKTKTPGLAPGVFHWRL
jgi:hypothetical protein